MKVKNFRTAGSFSDTGCDSQGCSQQVGAKAPSQPVLQEAAAAGASGIAPVRVFSYCNGLRELSEGLLACGGKLSHLGLYRVPVRSTLSDANRKSSYRVFETVYQELLKLYHPFILDSRLKGLSIRNLKVIDSTTIQLFSEILREVGRKPLVGRGGRVASRCIR
jgi:hypothetical protein